MGIPDPAPPRVSEASQRATHSPGGHSRRRRDRPCRLYTKYSVCLTPSEMWMPPFSRSPHRSTGPHSLVFPPETFLHCGRGGRAGPRLTASDGQKRVRGTWGLRHLATDGSDRRAEADPHLAAAEQTGPHRCRPKTPPFPERRAVRARDRTENQHEQRTQVPGAHALGPVQVRTGPNAGCPPCPPVRANPAAHPPLALDRPNFTTNCRNILPIGESIFGKRLSRSVGGRPDKPPAELPPTSPTDAGPRTPWRSTPSSSSCARPWPGCSGTRSRRCAWRRSPT